jgi:hypothetical protein
MVKPNLTFINLSMRLNKLSFLSEVGFRHGLVRFITPSQADTFECILFFQVGIVMHVIDTSSTGHKSIFALILKDPALILF